MLQQLVGYLFSFRKGVIVPNMLPRTSSPDHKKRIKWDGIILYLKTPDGKVTLLGSITTRKGGLTRAQKLKAVEHTDNWIEI